MNDVSAKAYEEYKVLKSEILDEVVDVSPGNCHVFCMQGNLQLGQPSHGKKMTVFFESFHVFYDPLVEYMENLGSGNGWLYLYCK